jgi:hypothetical protein
VLQFDAFHLSPQPIDMAATDSSMPVNGSYTPQSFEANTYSASSGSQQQEGGQAGNAQTSEIPKDEVGWYFVEQYYTTLSKSPDKLYVSTARCEKQVHPWLTWRQLFYNKRSQFVSGTEEDKVNVCVGQKVGNPICLYADFS